MDGIIDTVSAVHSLLPLLGLLRSHGKLVMVGAPDKPLELPVFPLIMGKAYDIFLIISCDNVQIIWWLLGKMIQFFVNLENRKENSSWKLYWRNKRDSRDA